MSKILRYLKNEHGFEHDFKEKEHSLAYIILNIWTKKTRFK